MKTGSSKSIRVSHRKYCLIKISPWGKYENWFIKVYKSHRKYCPIKISSWGKYENWFIKVYNNNNNNNIKGLGTASTFLKKRAQLCIRKLI